MATTKKKTKKPVRLYRGPISITVEKVGPLPGTKVLPVETQNTVNLKGDRAMGELLIAEIQRQIEKVDFFAVTIEGVS